MCYATTSPNSVSHPVWSSVACAMLPPLQTLCHIQCGALWHVLCYHLSKLCVTSIVDLCGMCYATTSPNSVSHPVWSSVACAMLPPLQTLCHIQCGALWHVLCYHLSKLCVISSVELSGMCYATTSPNSVSYPVWSSVACAMLPPLQTLCHIQCGALWHVLCYHLSKLCVTSSVELCGMCYATTSPNSVSYPVWSSLACAMLPPLQTLCHIQCGALWHVLCYHLSKLCVTSSVELCGMCYATTSPNSGSHPVWSSVACAMLPPLRPLYTQV